MVDWKQAKAPTPLVDQALRGHCGNGRSYKHVGVPLYWAVCEVNKTASPTFDNIRFPFVNKWIGAKKPPIWLCLFWPYKEGRGEEGYLEEVSMWSCACCSLLLWVWLCARVQTLAGSEIPSTFFVLPVPPPPPPTTSTQNFCGQQTAELIQQLLKEQLCVFHYKAWQLLPPAVTTTTRDIRNSKTQEWDN